MEEGLLIILIVLLISINILLMTLINKYRNTVTYFKTALENIYDKLESNRRIIRDIKLYYENFEEKTSNSENDMYKIRCYIKTLIDYNKTLITIDKAIFESLNKDKNKDNNNKDNNKNINNNNQKVDKSIPHADYLRYIANNVDLIRDSLLSLGNDIYKYIILPAKERKDMEDFNAKAQGTT